jgi:hypothetical protein
MTGKYITRREFIKAAAAGLSLVYIQPLDSLFLKSTQNNIVQFPSAEKLGRVLDGRVPIKMRPNDESPDVGELNIDDVVPWLREISGSRPLWLNQRFVEIPEGYVYAPNLQPVYNLPNQPISEMPKPEGFWVEVSVPFVDLVLANPPARSPWLKNTNTPRLYYSQIMWVDEIKVDETGQTWYRVMEKYGSFGDIFWVKGEALRLIKDEEMTPISPEVQDKRVEVDLLHQTLSCFEGNNEVYFCRVSTGGKYDSEGNQSDKWATPVGTHTIWRKLVSVHMTGGTTGGGYDLPGIGWTVLFSGKGMAIHSTFWHNSYGIAKSHGCVNARPEDAKWIFRWTLPVVDPDPGELTISGEGSTKVFVKEQI